MQRLLAQLRAIALKWRDPHRRLAVQVWVGAAVMLAVLTSSEAAAQPTQLRVLSYNIHHGAGVDGKLDLERIARVIESSRADVVALQEVDQGARRTGRVDQPAELARLTRMGVVFEKNIDHEGGAYGNAVLSRAPIKAHQNIALPCLLRKGVADDREQRGALAVEIELPPGITVTFISTHLDCRPWEDERLESARLLNRKFEASEWPALVVGDLNAIRASSVMAEFVKRWKIAGEGEKATVPASAPRRQIDFVLYRPADRWRVVEVKVLDEPVASDHRPLLAVLELSPATP